MLLGYAKFDSNLAFLGVLNPESFLLLLISVKIDLDSFKFNNKLVPFEGFLASYLKNTSLELFVKTEESKLLLFSEKFGYFLKRSDF